MLAVIRVTAIFQSIGESHKERGLPWRIKAITPKHYQKSSFRECNSGIRKRKPTNSQSEGNKVINQQNQAKPIKCQLPIKGH